MIILGIDPGTRFAGFGILHKEGRKVGLIDHGCLKMSSKKSLVARIEIFHDFFKEKIIQYNITDLSLETPFLGKNASNFLKLGYLRGILYLLASKHMLHIHEFSPREVKMAITGYGGAAKEQVSCVVLRLFPGVKNPQRDDITDAIAVSLCGVWHSCLRA